MHLQIMCEIFHISAVYVIGVGEKPFVVWLINFL